MFLFVYRWNSKEILLHWLHLFGEKQLKPAWLRINKSTELLSHSASLSPPPHTRKPPVASKKVSGEAVWRESEAVSAEIPPAVWTPQEDSPNLKVSERILQTSSNLFMVCKFHREKRKFSCKQEVQQQHAAVGPTATTTVLSAERTFACSNLLPAPVPEFCPHQRKMKKNLQHEVKQVCGFGRITADQTSAEHASLVINSYYAEWQKWSASGFRRSLDTGEVCLNKPHRYNMVWVNTCLWLAARSPLKVITDWL